MRARVLRSRAHRLAVVSKDADFSDRMSYGGYLDLPTLLPTADFLSEQLGRQVRIPREVHLQPKRDFLAELNAMVDAWDEADDARRRVRGGVRRRR
mgnify:CR=1 FL=1